MIYTSRSNSTETLARVMHDAMGHLLILTLSLSHAHTYKGKEKILLQPSQQLSFTMSVILPPSIHSRIYFSRLFQTFNLILCCYSQKHWVKFELCTLPLPCFFPSLFCEVKALFPLKKKKIKKPFKYKEKCVLYMCVCVCVHMQVNKKLRKTNRYNIWHGEVLIRYVCALLQYIGIVARISNRCLNRMYCLEELQPNFPDFKTTGMELRPTQ